MAIESGPNTERESITLETHRGLGHFWGAARAGPAAEKLLVEKHRGYSSADHQSMSVLREGESWISGAGEGTSPLDHQRIGVSLGGGLCWPVVINQGWEQMGAGVHRALYKVGGANSPSI